MNLKAIITAMAVCIECSTMAVLSVSAAPEPSLLRAVTYVDTVYILYQEDAVTDKLYQLSTKWNADSNVYQCSVSPVNIHTELLTETLGSAPVFGDVLVLDGWNADFTYPASLYPGENASAENLGRYDTLLTVSELILKEKTDPQNLSDELYDGEKVYTDYTFSSEPGDVYTFHEQYGSYYIGNMSDVEPGGTVKAITYLDTAVPMEVLAAQPLPAGDPDEDGAVNSKDASAVLRTAAQIGAKNKPTLNLAQRNACDVNGDGVVNANDASDILRYAAYIGAKNPYQTISDFLAK